MANVYAAERAQPLAFTTPKDPGDTVDYRFDWASELTTGETISSQTVVADTGLTKDSVTAVGDEIVVTVSGGTAGRSYKVRCQIVTSNSRTLEVTGIVDVANR